MNIHDMPFLHKTALLMETKQDLYFITCDTGDPSRWITFVTLTLHITRCLSSCQGLSQIINQILAIFQTNADPD